MKNFNLQQALEKHRLAVLGNFPGTESLSQICYATGENYCQHFDAAQDTPYAYDTLFISYVFGDVYEYNPSRLTCLDDFKIFDIAGNERPHVELRHAGWQGLISYTENATENKLTFEIKNPAGYPKPYDLAPQSYLSETVQDFLEYFAEVSQVNSEAEREQISKNISRLQSALKQSNRLLRKLLDK